MSKPSIQVTRDNQGILIVESVRPSDFHAHFRQGPMMMAITPEIARWTKYILAMPNTYPIISTIDLAASYREDINSILHKNEIDARPVITLYFTNLLTPLIVEKIAKSHWPIGIKSYPPEAGTTTNSGQGVPLFDLPEILDAMQANGVRLLIHGECRYDKNGHELPHAEREAYFMKEIFPELRTRWPRLKICLEHISTKDAVEAVKSDPSGNTVCTITPHHAMLTNEVFAKSWAVHARCMPYLKTIEDRDAVRAFMVSGDPRTILGTDCAPQPSAAKLKDFEDAACGCYIPHAWAMYVANFALMNALDERLVKFSAYNGPDWWGLPRPEITDTIRVRRELIGDIPAPTVVPAEDDIVIPLGWTEEDDKLEVGMALAMAA